MTSPRSTITHGPFVLDHTEDHPHKHSSTYSIKLAGVLVGSLELDTGASEADLLDQCRSYLNYIQATYCIRMTERLHCLRVDIVECGVSGDPHTVKGSFREFAKNPPALKPNSLYSITMYGENRPDVPVYIEHGVSASSNLFVRPVPPYAWLLFMMPENTFSASPVDWVKPSVETLLLVLGSDSFTRITPASFCRAAGISESLNTPEAILEHLTHKGWINAAAHFGFGLLPVMASFNA